EAHRVDDQRLDVARAVRAFAACHVLDSEAPAAAGVPQNKRRMIRFSYCCVKSLTSRSASDARLRSARNHARSRFDFAVSPRTAWAAGIGIRYLCATTE